MQIINEALNILYLFLPFFLAALIVAVIVLIFVRIVTWIGLFYASGHKLRHLPYYISVYLYNLQQKRKF